MPLKRKRTATQPTPPLSEGPRRNARRIARAEAQPDGDATNKDILSSKQAVESAMHDLSEMEQRLMREARRQRLAVESSDLSVDVDSPCEKATQTKNKDGRSVSRSANKDVGAACDDVDAVSGIGDDQDAQDDEVGASRGARRPPPIHSEKLPLPWSGRLGYACLNTYLRAANPPVFCSRTCRLSSIIEHRHPLADPSQPEHATKNRPDKSKPASIDRGLQYVKHLGLANAKDIVKMIRWNDKYGIKFMRLSSEMFPFASHQEHGYSLKTFAAEVLAEAGRVIAELGHRVTTHPGQYTQIGSPRKEVVEAAVRDLEYHNELLSLLSLPHQLDRDAVMILHMGGTYGDKAATLDRFRQNYAKLSDGVKWRLVLENDDVSWTVHDLLPICEELNIPLVLDFHHHNILFDENAVREGTRDIQELYARIKATWTRKGITQKMHYSESTPAAVTPRERRKHSARVRTLPPCVCDMDLMIEAKDKEQAVFELMRTFKLPGWNRFNDIVPHERDDESRKAVTKKKGKKIEVEMPERVVSFDDFGMGGSEKRVYWPEGMEEWLRPKKRVVKKKGETEG
ncbi:hypothetical protein CDD81_1791 [Ophiocordyceps australis]|uniref:UV-damage endonuclease n=1 Tax=Ophiocordyceps australis TaxID=1399860 RepID=A0A2C5Y891_9HYPO|nr:hypothetical protein CDD81_1791 [Ophiocordyceps australis]